MADVKDSKLRTLIVFVGSNLVTAFGFSSRQAAARGLEEPARSWGKRLCLGWTRQGQTRKKVVECLAFILNPVKPSKIKAKKEKKDLNEPSGLG